jgi:Fic family protein
MPDYSWINFRINLEKLPWTTWVKLGECVAKCEQIKTVPLKPYLKNQLHLIYLAKGLHATTAIEGNTLTEDQVRDLIQKKLTLPASKEYLRREVNNVLEACNEIAIEISKGTFGRITVEKICHYNKKILQNNVPHDEAAVPGKIRNHNVVVGNVYRAPDAQMVSDMMKSFCRWMNSDVFQNKSMPVHFAIIKAVAAHLYIAWIHPFGDGNGRVARLLEFAILLSSGIPSPAAHLLSNHYNATRAEYYTQLDKAGKTSDPSEFFGYAIQGFYDGLGEQIEYVREHIISICWREYIYETFHKAGVGKVIKRQRALALTISEQKGPIDKGSLLLLMSDEYRGKTARALVRDLNKLVNMGIILREGDKYTANKDSILKFLPFSA